MTRRSKVLGALAAVLILLMAWPVVTHYRAKWRLEAYRARLKAKGEKLAVVELAPARPAASLSGGLALRAAGSRLRPYASYAGNSFYPMKLVAPAHALVAWQQEILPTSDSTNAWPVLQAMLAENEAALAGVRTALQTPELAFDLDYSQGFALPLPHLGSVKGIAQWLSAAAILDLHEGRSSNAWENLEALANLVQRYKDEPLMISELVRIASGALALSATWEALQADCPDEQLQRVQAAWASVDLLAHAAAALAMERAVGQTELAQARESYAVMAGTVFGGGTAGSGLDELAQLGKDVLDNPEKGFRNFMHRYPGYWHWKWWQSYEDELANAQAIQAGLEAVRAIQQQKAFAPALAQADQELARIRKAHPRAGNWLGYSLAAHGSLRKFLSRVTAFETQRSLLTTAIALKRYHRRHRAYPAELSALVPELLPQLPRDPMDGKPLRYRLTPDHSFLLYSVGEDGIDNDGNPRLISQGSNSSQWWLARDAVWPSPATAEEVKAEFEKLAHERERSGSTATFMRRYGIRPPATPAPGP